MYEQHESYNSLQCLDGRYFSEIVVSMTVSVFFSYAAYKAVIM